MAINFQHIQTKVGSPTIADDFQNYVYQNCSNPQRVKVFNSVTGRFEYRDDMPCGRCWHCTNTRQTEWVTRFFLHNEDWPYRYFVTLTYKPIYNTYDFENVCLLKEFDETLPLWDADNSNRTFACHPCLLSRNHLRNYLKRLRKSLDGLQISMYAVGEYGKKHHRPHYHLLVWSKKPIERQKFVDAWSKKWCKVGGICKPYRGQNADIVQSIYFGDVDVVDLNKPRFTSQHGNTLSDVFKYVSKYVCKYQITDFDEPNEEKNNQNYKNTPKFTKYLRIQKVLRNFAPVILKQRYLYEKKCIKSFNSAFADYVQLSEPAVCYSPYQFCRTFAPFGVCSCKNAIGKDYLMRNIESLAQGRFAPSIADGCKFRYPSYYRRKIAEYQAPIFVAKITPCRTSSNLKTIAFCRSNYRNLDAAFHAASADASSANRERLYSTIRNNSFFQSRKGGKRSYRTDCFLTDISTHEYLFYDDLLHIFNCYIYKHGAFHFSRSRTFADVAHLVCKGYDYLLQRYQQNEVLRQNENNARNHVKAQLGAEYNRLWLNAVETLDTNLKIHQLNYIRKRAAYTINLD